MRIIEKKIAGVRFCGECFYEGEEVFVKYVLFGAMCWEKMTISEIDKKSSAITLSREVTKIKLPLDNVLILSRTAPISMDEETLENSCVDTNDFIELFSADYDENAYIKRSFKRMFFLGQSFRKGHTVYIKFLNFSDEKAYWGRFKLDVILNDRILVTHCGHTDSILKFNTIRMNSILMMKYRKPGGYEDVDFGIIEANEDNDLLYMPDFIKDFCEKVDETDGLSEDFANEQNKSNDESKTIPEDNKNPRRKTDIIVVCGGCKLEDLLDEDVSVEPDEYEKIFLDFLKKRELLSDDPFAWFLRMGERIFVHISSKGEKVKYIVCDSISEYTKVSETIGKHGMYQMPWDKGYKYVISEPIVLATDTAEK